MSDLSFLASRDMELLSKGWRFQSASGLYQERDEAPWLTRAEARRQAGIDIPAPAAPPEPPAPPEPGYFVPLTTSGLVVLRAYPDLLERLKEIDVPMLPTIYASRGEAQAAITAIERIIGQLALRGPHERA